MALVTKSFSDIITFTRASTATYFDATGTLQSAAINTPRFDYNPSTLAAQGLLIEEARTNSIRNNTMQGAVAGTPGTLPTNWAVSNLGTLTQQVVGTGTVNGITYIDIRFSGTTSTTQLSIRLEPNGTLAVPASNGQTWTISMWSAIVGGGLTNITSRGYSLLYWDNANGFLGGGGAGTFNSTATLMRSSEAVTIAQVGTTFIQPQIYLVFNSGVAIDITLRIGLPQLEQGAFVTSVIPTTTTALTRSADVASVNTLSPWYNATEGTLFAQYIRAGLTVSGGAAGFDDGTANNMIRFVFGTATPANQRFDVNTGGVSQAAILVNATGVVNTLYKDAGAYKLNDIAATENGAVVGVDTAATIPTVNILRLGTNPIGAYLNGWIQRFTYYPTRLSNAQLQAITA